MIRPLVGRSWAVGAYRARSRRGLRWIRFNNRHIRPPSHIAIPISHRPSSHAWPRCMICSVVLIIASVSPLHHPILYPYIPTCIPVRHPSATTEASDHLRDRVDPSHPPHPGPSARPPGASLADGLMPSSRSSFPAMTSPVPLRPQSRVTGDEKGSRFPSHLFTLMTRHPPPTIHNTPYVHDALLDRRRLLSPS